MEDFFQMVVDFLNICFDSIVAKNQRAPLALQAPPALLSQVLTMKVEEQQQRQFRLVAWKLNGSPVCDFNWLSNVTS